MSSPKLYKATANVWLTDHGVMAVARGEEVKDYHFYVSDGDLDMADKGWLKVHSQEMQVVVPVTPSTAAAFAVQVLQAEIVQLNKDNREKVAKLEGKIKDIASLAYNPSTPTKDTL